MELEKRRIVVVVSGGIAAYKAADLVSRLRKAGALVRVVMTESAHQFVAPLTFEALSGHPIYEHVFEQASSWEMEHISWARWAELVVVAPATANLLAKLAHGLADDAATTLALAWDGPLWVAPAMNTAMWRHPATQHNLSVLRGRGVRVIEPGSGQLACGEIGPGRMAEPAEIVEILREAQKAPAGNNGVNGDAPLASPAGPLAGKTVLITTGPTREALDPIRYLSNRSTGQMGCQLAAAAVRLGARVLLVHGPLSVPVPPGVEAVPVESARDMLAAVQSRWGNVDLAVFAAAVANYEAQQSDAQKIKGGATLNLELTRTPDIAGWCGANRREGQLLIGFCAESRDLLETARRKLEAKQLDLICANPIGEPGLGFAATENQVTILGRDGAEIPLARAGKAEVAGMIWSECLAWAGQQLIAIK